MKPQLTLLAFFLFFGALSAQVKFKVKLLPDNQSYQINFKPEISWSNPLSTTNAAQVTLRMPTGSFVPGPITNLKGTWEVLTFIESPTEAPSYDYLMIYLKNPISGSQITYTNGVEIPMFSIRNNGGCPGVVELIDNITDPFIEPNSQNVGVSNYLTVLGASPNSAFAGDYTSFDANCAPMNNPCNIEVFDVTLCPPTACGLTDGKVIIDAVSNDGSPLQYTLTLGAGSNETWSTPIGSPTGNIFSNLAAGDTYYIGVRDIGGCIVDLGEYQLPGPLAAIIQGVDLNNPDCGQSNGSITINAISASGNQLQYSTTANGPWQTSSTFGNLAEGTYSFYVWDATSNCKDPVGTYTLTGCVPPSCTFTYDLVHLGNGKYEFLLQTDTTLNGPFDNFVTNMQMTIKVPTGGFVLSNLVESIPGPDFEVVETVIAPVEDLLHDYITINLLNATDEIPIVDGSTVHLFTFENSGTCVGDSIRFMQDNDPFYGVTSAGQLITVSGAQDPLLCLANNAVICEAAPPVAPDCIITYDLVHLGNGLYEFRMKTDTTLVGAFNTFTSSLQTTLKVATGGFEVSSLTSLIQGVDFGISEVAISPVEAPNFDYFTIGLVSATNSIPYTSGNTVSLFQFENTGSCLSDSVYFMLDGDPFQGVTSASQYITVSGLGNVNICLQHTSVVCDNMSDPCAGFTPGFTANDACEGVPMSFTNTTISNDPVTSWSWNFGDNSTATGQSPSPHTYSSSGNFEVSLTVTTQNGCNATFSDFVTVFPSPGDAPVSSYDICNGVGVSLDSPDNITSASWSPSTGLDCTNCPNPVANPASTTVYTVTYTNLHGCTNTSQVTVNVISKPIFNNVAINQISDCNLTDGSIVVTAGGVAGVEYGLDSGSGVVWQSNNSFTNLAAGQYTLFIRNADDSCPVAYSGNPIQIVGQVDASITSVVPVQPAGCLNNGSITINATGGQAPLQYSINGTTFQASNVFNGLGAGTYTPSVKNANGACLVTANPITFTQPNPPTLGDVPNQNICVGSSTTITVQSSSAIASFQITGTGVYTNAVVNGSTLTFTASANALGTTTYNVQITDANSCSSTETFNLTGVAVPTASFTVSQTVCVNGNVVLDFNGVSLPTATLNWSLAGATIVSQSQATASQPAKKTMVVKWNTGGPKTVTLEVDNGGCKVTAQQTINLADFDPNASTAVLPAGCGNSNGSIDLSVVGGPYNYNWNNQQTTQDIANLAAGTFTVTITEPNSGCSTTETAVVGGTAPVSITSNSTTPAPDCAGGSGGGSLTVSITGGTAPYVYSIAGQTPVSGNLTSVTFNNLSAGAYQVSVTDAVGCSDVETVAIQAVSPTLLPTLSFTNASCSANDGSLTAVINGGAAPYNYSLYVNNTLSGTFPVTGTTVALNALAPGNYLIIFEDNNGCVAPVGGTLVRNQGVFPASAAITNAGCGSSNGQVVLNGLPQTYDLLWEDEQGNDLGSSATITGLDAGVYTATLTVNGCTSDSSFVVSSIGGQVVTIGQIVPATCGLANGSFSFTVSNGGAFQYDILGQNIQPGFGTPSVPVTITGLAEGAIVIKITDLLQTSCRVFEAVAIPGGDAFQTSATVTLSTGCGNENGQICLEITGGTAPYTVVSTDGTIVPGNAPNKFCVTNLYEGTVDVTITDAANCSKTITQFMGDFTEPNITADSVEVVQPDCPGDFGSIVSNANVQYQVFNSLTNAFVGNTPLTSLQAGTYRVVYTVNGCTDSLSNLVINSVADWVVVSSIEKEYCDQGNGSIALSIAGATAPYDIEWSNDSTSMTITGLQSGTYSASISDANGCLTIEDFIVADTCNNGPLPCDTISETFYIDTFIVHLNGSLTEICLPTNETNLADFNLQLDNAPYDRTIGDCGSTTNFYDGLDMLPSNGDYTLEEWTHDGEKVEDLFCQNLNDLVTHLNDNDPTGNWVLDGSTVFGGAPGSVYGNLKIKHNQSGSILDLPPSKLSVPHPTVLVDNHSQLHILVAQHPSLGCLDTLFINVLAPPTPVSDTIQVNVGIGETETVCFSVDELFGTIEFLSNEWTSTTNNAQVNSTDTTCVEVIGLDEGIDQAIIVICDDLGYCDTTVLLINVGDVNTNVIVHNGFSPNNDGVNDYFVVENIEMHPKNQIEIYNRWGKQVYKTKSYRNEWHGEYRDTRLPDGSYFYVLRVEIDGKEKEFKGFVEIRR